MRLKPMRSYNLTAAVFWTVTSNCACVHPAMRNLEVHEPTRRVRSLDRDSQGGHLGFGWPLREVKPSSLEQCRRLAMLSAFDGKLTKSLRAQSSGRDEISRIRLAQPSRSPKQGKTCESISERKLSHFTKAWSLTRFDDHAFSSMPSAKSNGWKSSSESRTSILYRLK